MAQEIGPADRLGATAPRAAGVFSKQFSLLTVLSLVIGLDSIGYSIALASLMFAGDLSSGIGMAVIVILTGNIILSLLLAFRSQLKTHMAVTQDLGATILAVSLAGSLVSVASDAKLATAFAIISLATLSTGAVLFLTGYFKAGRLVRFFPLEVLAGFMAATGCLLVIGGIAMVGHVEASLWGVLTINNSTQIFQILASLLLAGIIYVALSHFKKPFLLLGILISAALLFHAWLRFVGFSLFDATNFGLLPKIPLTQELSYPFPTLFSQVDWPAVLAAAPVIGTVVLLSLFAAMMNISALELATGKELNVNREIMLIGGGNFLVAAVGGSPGYSDLASTQLLNKNGVTMRGAGFIVAAVEFLGVFYAAYIVSVVPTLVTASLILYYGFDLVKDWLIATRKSFSLREWGVVLLIVVVSVFYSFLVAVLAGFLIATILFAYSYANAPIVRNETTLANLPSTTDRAPEERKLLTKLGQTVEVFQLQGFLFFGTSEQVVERMREAVAAGEVSSVILDFSRVTDLDSASANAFKRIENLAIERNFSVILSGLNEGVAEALRRSGLNLTSNSKITLRTDLDIALEAAEVDLLSKAPTSPKAKSLPEHFAVSPAQERQLRGLFSIMTRKTYAPGSEIIRAGAVANDIYFIESGRVVILHGAQTAKPKRLRTMTAGAILGEVAFSLGSLRTADVVAESESVVLSMSASQLKTLRQQDPNLAAQFDQLICRALAEKVLAANRMTEHLG